MELEFDTRCMHPSSMLVPGPSSSGKTVFTKQVLNKSDKQFEKLYWLYSEWQNGYKDCPGISFLSGMPSSLDAYIELSGPIALVFDDMMMQCAFSELIAQAFTQKRHHQNISVKLILKTYTARERYRETCTSTQSTWYYFEIHEIRVNLGTWKDSWNRNTLKYSSTLTWTPPHDRIRISWWI